MRHVGTDADTRTPPLPRPARAGRLPVVAWKAAAATTIAVLLGTMSCGDGTTEPPPYFPEPTTVTVTPATAELVALDATVQLSAQVQDQNGWVMAGATVTWASSDAAVAAVDASGQVTAAGNGSATITAAAGSASGTAAVTVAQVVSAVAVSPEADTLLAFGDTVRLVAEATDANGHAVAASEFSWASSDTVVARVDDLGQVTAAGNGSATITAAAGSASGTAAVTVAQVVSAVAVSPEADTLLAFGDTVRLVAEATDANGHAVAASEFSWASSDTVVARVDASGLVQSFADGAAVVTATASEVTGIAELRVVGTTPPTITYLDEAGNPATDTSSITDHRIKVSFDERVSFLSTERYEALTPSLARRMIELNANNTNTLTGVFGFQVEVGVEDEQSFFLVTPNASYPPGAYSVRVKNYVATEQAATVLNSSIADRYFSFIDREYSSFSTPTIDVLCDSNASGYFQLAYEDGSQDCVRIPQVVFTFTPRGGREMIESNFDPTLAVKIYFDSEVVYLSESGEWRDIAKEDILEMVEISVKPEYSSRRVDHVSVDGAIGPNLVSVSNVGGRTVVTIESPPYDSGNHEGIYGFHVPYNVIVKNFATRADVSRIAASGSVDSYLEDTTTYYRGAHGGLYPYTSCDLEYGQAFASVDRYNDQHSDIQGIENFVYDPDVMDALSSLPGDGAVAGAMFDVDQTHLEKTDPGTRHVIDLAFITSDIVFENASGDWRTYFDEQVIKRLDKMFQYSGVNVEFRVSLIAPFSEFRQHLYCDLPTMDNLVYSSNGRDATAAVMSELIPIIRKQYPVDIFVAVPSGGAGYASIGDGLRHFPVSAMWSSSVVVGARPNFFDMSGSDRNLRGRAFHFGYILAHEIGHSLRLHHDVDTLGTSINWSIPGDVTALGA